MANFLKELDNKCCLTVSTDHTSTTSLYKKGKENEPIATLTVSGDGKISLLRLAVYVVGIITAVTAVMYVLGSVKKWLCAMKIKLACKKEK